MDRRTFLLSSLVAPFFFKAGGSVMAAVTYNASDASITMNFADDPNAPLMSQEGYVTDMEVYFLD